MEILCFGWYGHKNLGDELFKDAFKKLFPEHNFKFIDYFTLVDVNNYEVIFFGGGSFLNQPIPIPENKIEIYSKLLRKKIFYIGVGLETDFHDDHTDLMKCASIIAPRTKNNRFDSNYFKVIEIPDLVYALNDTLDLSDKANPQSVLILPNVSVVPTYNDPHWMHASWDYFKTEMSQFLDYLINTKYDVKFANMCQDHNLNDNFASYSIMSAMVHRDTADITNFIDTTMISTFGLVITQRFHGVILSDMAGVQCLPIHHHNKLKIGNSISYYELSKNKLIDNFHLLKNSQVIKKSINFNAFNQLVEEVNKLLKE